MPKKMHAFGISLAVIFLPFILHLPLVQGYVQTINITNDPRHYIEFGDFGFTTTGRLFISVSSIIVTTTNNTTPTNSSRLGFYTAPEIQDVNPNINCSNDNSELTKVFTFSELPPPPQSSLSKTLSIKKPGLYNIMFGNCNPSSNVSMLIHIEAYNLDPNGRKDYLPDGKTQLPTMYTIFTLFYISFFITWLYICHSNKPFVKKIHILMASLLLVKALDLALAAEEKYHIKISGSPRGWDTWFDAFLIIKGLLLFIVVALIGTGWSFLKPSLQVREKWLLIVGVVLQVFVNTSYILVLEYNNKYYDKYFRSCADFWFQSFFFADVACCVLISVPILWSMKSIGENAKMDGTAAANLKKMKRFFNFYVSLVIYLFIKNYIILLISGLFDVFVYNHSWLIDFSIEIASFIFYLSMFYLFQPLETNHYFALPSGDDEEAAALKTIRSLTPDIP